MAGIPTKMTPEKVKLLDRICRMKPTLRDAAEILSLNPSTIEKHIKKHHNQTFSEYREQKMAWTRNMIIRGLLEKCKQGNMTALIYCSKNLCGWSDTPKETSGEKGPTVYYKLVQEEKESKK